MFENMVTNNISSYELQVKAVNQVLVYLYIGYSITK